MALLRLHSRRVVFGLVLATASVGVVTSMAPVAFADARTEARAHFRKGMAAISAGKYEVGVEELKEANRILPHPNVLFNIGRAYVEMGDLENGILYYRQYAENDVPDREEVRAIVTQLQNRLDRQKAALAAAQQPASPATPTPAATSTPAPGTPPGTGTGTGPGTTPPTTPATPPPTTPPGTPPAVPGAAAGTPPSAASRGDATYEESVVTASRGSAQSPLDSPNSTTVLTEQDIRLSGITKIPELLRRVAGVDVMETTAGFTEVSIRGFNQRFSNKLLVLIDGRSVFLDYFGGTLWESFAIDVDQIERIEVVRGPGSALYGADAFAGVVNILTKAPGTGRTGARVGVGDGAQTYGSVRAVGRDGDFAYRVSAGYTRYPRWSREFAASGRVDLNPVTTQNDLGSEFSRLDLRTTYRLGKDVTLGVGGGVAQGFMDAYAIGALKNWSFKDTRFADASVYLNTPKVKTRVFFNHSGVDRIGAAYGYVGQSTYGSPFTANVVDVESVYADTFDTGPVSQAVNLGLNYRLRNAEAYFTGPERNEHHYGVFGQDAIHLGKAATLVLSGRVDRVPYVQRFEASPRASLLVRPTDRSTIRATFSTAFRKPTFLEGYTFLPVQGPQGSVSSVVDTLRTGRVQPERILTAELGYINQMSEYFDVDLTAYANRVTDLLTLAPPQFLTPAQLAAGAGAFDTSASVARFPVQYSAFVNQCVDFNVLGGEAGVRTYPVQGLDLFANYALNVVSPDRPPGCDVPDDQRTSVHKVNLGAQVRTKPGIDGEVTFHYLTSQRWVERDLDTTRGELVYKELPLPGYTLLNARLGYRFPGDHAELSATAWNLLGNVHQEHPFGQFVGRRFMGFFQYQF